MEAALAEIEEYGQADVWVAVSDRPGFRWGVFHPRNGGHWESTDSVVAAGTLR